MEWVHRWCFPLSLKGWGGILSAPGRPGWSIHGWEAGAIVGISVIFFFDHGEVSSVPGLMVADGSFLSHRGKRTVAPKLAAFIKRALNKVWRWLGGGGWGGIERWGSIEMNPVKFCTGASLEASALQVLHLCFRPGAEKLSMTSSVFGHSFLGNG